MFSARAFTTLSCIRLAGDFSPIVFVKIMCMISQKLWVRHSWSYLAALSAVTMGLQSPIQASEPSTDSDHLHRSDNAGSSLSFELPDAWTHGRVIPPTTSDVASDSEPFDLYDLRSLGKDAIEQDSVLTTEASSRSQRLQIPSAGLNPPSGFAKDAPVLQELPPPPPRSSADRAFDSLFSGGSDSLVAIAIGYAEGTRTQDGSKTFAYYGHTDPGNQAWNIGTFSYQHGAESPDEADQKQLSRLYEQATQLQQQVTGLAILWDDETQLNALDLANQSPQAALGAGGFIERLRQAYDMGMDKADAIVWARTRSYLDPETGRWNAPGLGNTVQGITSDQSRRQQAIAQALAYHQSASRQLNTDDSKQSEQEEERINLLLSLDLEAI